MEDPGNADERDDVTSAFPRFERASSRGQTPVSEKTALESPRESSRDRKADV